ncbi:hypothetical protein KAR91_68345 [Candidatus Pacearchaeota archaeon]|nr:hypothetical protein [Candidatus Pacearchaeota archaeon]
MGIRLLGSSSCSCSCPSGRSRNMLAKSSGCLSCIEAYKRQPRNPDPSNYEVLKHKQYGSLLIVMLKYHDCTNYEGTKILVFEGIEILDLYKQEVIDPHFCDDVKHHSPIARFVPTEEGWEYAVRFCIGG